jgi:hypothetical protein
MTDQEINTAIAEACGFTDIMWPTGFHQQMSDERGKKYGGIWRFQIPDYCNELNEMYKAEEILTKEQIEIYCEHLNPKYHGIWWGIHTTAQQRAKAFLKTINRWKETKND